MKYRAVLFDLDGTLANTLEDLADSTNWCLRELGLPEHPVDAYRYMVGSGKRKLAQAALPPDRQDLVDKLLQMMTERYAGHYLDKTRLYDRIEELLAELGRRGLRLAVLSNKPDEFARLLVAKLLPQTRFDVVMGERGEARRKPDPACALAIAARMDIPAPEFVYVGDTDVDMMTGRAAGMFTVGALWGFRSREELAGAGAQVLIERPIDLLGLLD